MNINDAIATAFARKNAADLAIKAELLKSLAAEADDKMHRAATSGAAKHHAARVSELLSDLREVRAIQVVQDAALRAGY